MPVKRGEFQFRKAFLPEVKVIQRLVVTKLWTNRRATEDRDECTGENAVHLEKYHADILEASEDEDERIWQHEVAGTAWLLPKAGIFKSR